MSKISRYVCDICGKESVRRFKVKAKRLKPIDKYGEYGHYIIWRWRKIDLCEGCYNKIVSECCSSKGGQNG